MDKTLTKPSKGEKPEKKKKNKFGEDYELSPVCQNVTDGQLRAGLLMRSLVVSVLTFGLLLFICDCFKLGVSAGTVFLYSFAFGTSFGMIAAGKKLTVAGLILLVVTVGVEIVMNPNVGAFVPDSVSGVLNGAAVVFQKAGYQNVYDILVSIAPSAVMGKELSAGGVYLLAFVLSLLFTLSVAKKTVLSPVIIISILILAPGITYNLPDNNFGFAITIVALLGMIVMRLFDSAYKAKKADKKRRASLGGFAGGSVTLLAFLCIIIPSATMKGQWRDISSISKPMSVARDIVTSVISGDMPNLGEMGIVTGMDEQNSRKVDPKTITYTGKSMLTLTKKYYKSVPVYLRGWIADGAFDGYTWFSPSNDVTDLYKEKLSEKSAELGLGEVYTPDAMTTAFYEFLGDEYGALGDKGYTDHSKDGYNIYNFDIDMVLGSGTGNLLYLPSVTNSDTGIMTYQTTAPYRGQNKQFFDGMVLTNWFNLNKSYSVNAFVTTFAVAGSAKNFFLTLDYVTACYDFIRFCRTQQYDYYPSYIECYQYKTELEEKYNFEENYPESTFLSDFLAMDEEEQEEYYQKYVVMTDLYSEYAYGTYTLAHDKGNYRASIMNIVNQLDIDSSDTDYDKIVKCVQYLASNFTYTLTPELGAANNYSPYEKFLNETRQGSCVQYATTLTLMLRELGFVARYVEGFIAKDFSTDEAGNSVCDVKDENAHAWVEVYYPGYGWLTVEATSRYAKSFYGTDVKTKSNPDVNPYDPGDKPSGGGDSEFHHNDEEELPPEEQLPTVVTRKVPWKKIFKVVFLLALFGGGGYLLYRWLKKRGDAAVYNRTRLIETAVYGADDDEFKEVAHGIDSEIFLMLNIGGYAPNVGELPSEYAKRLDETCMYVTDRPFSEVMALIEKQEFSLEKDPEELKKLAEYFDLLWKDIYKTMKKPQRLWYRYIKLWL